MRARGLGPGPGPPSPGPGSGSRVPGPRDAATVREISLQRSKKNNIKNMLGPTGQNGKGTQSPVGVGCLKFLHPLAA